jgi:Protein of unknown function (DUF1553)/Protein of unknown function (DUF1549)
MFTARTIPLQLRLLLASIGSACVLSAGEVRPRGDFTLTAADRQHWAFQPLQHPAVTAGQNGIDHFIRAALDSAGLKPAARASDEALVRRITLDLTGLPPTPEEIDAFVQSAIQNPKSAVENLIDRLLASPHYGERWGRHWLDLARFAETDGFEHDATRPHSWRYRDYVIKAFNDDKPYDRFIREQIAGDELWPADSDALIATGFALLGPDMVDSSDQIQRRHNTLNDMTDTTALVFLGLTMGCARCHDHKFEPISQRDYYAMQAFFTPAKFEKEKPVPSPESRAIYDVEMKVFSENPKVRELMELEAPVREKLREKKIAKLAPEAQVAHRTPEDQRNAEQANLVLETSDKVIVSDKDVAAAFSGTDSDRHKTLLGEVKKLPHPPSLPKAMTLSTKPNESAKTFILRRGEYSQPMDEVSAGFPSILGPPISASAQSNRTALANWIASPQNPLTARVMVNRIWQHHFGRGLVATPSEFGTHGAKPSHPELLDWLAGEFIASGWSVKHMHKLMLMSETFQQASNAEVGMLNVESASSIPHSQFPIPNFADPENKLLSRMNRLRLEGEVIRDCLLAISGQLNLDMGGPGIFPPIPKEIFKGAKSGWPQNDHARDWSRRSIYIFARRNLRFPFLEVFDAPDSNLSCPSRERSTTAPQSLTLLNADEVTSAAALTAARLKKDAASADGQITLAYRLVLGRKPNAKELSIARDFLAKSPLEEFCRALFNLNDFVYAH